MSCVRTVVMVATTLACAHPLALSGCARKANDAGADAGADVDAGADADSDADADSSDYDAATCAAWFSQVDDTIAAPPEPGPAQRTDLIAEGGGLRQATGKYAATWAPTGWADADADARVVLIALHGTGGYPEADWTDWNGYLGDRGWAFIGVSYLQDGVYDDATTVYERVHASIEALFAACGTSITVHLTGFSRGSAQSFPVALLDRQASGPINGVIANAGAWPPGGEPTPEIAAEDGNATAMTGVRMWGWCGTADEVQGWPMCDGLEQAFDWVRAHGGSADTLYVSEGADHGDFVKDAVAVGTALDWLAGLPAR